MGLDDMIDAIRSFKGDHKFLSNFYPCKIVDPETGIVYPSVEHFYVAQKTTELCIKEYIATIPDAGAVKRYGRTIQIRHNWESIKRGVMLYAIYAKFSEANPELLEMLLATGDVFLIEGNDWNDTYWGVCNKTGKGSNFLGLTIETVRTVRRAEISKAAP
jgi:ribA/ribD-fused uncharacterized protein